MEKGFLSVKKLLMENIKYQIGTGDKILFWRDWWVGDRTLAAKFPDLFKCALDKDAKVKSYMSRIGDNVVWSPILRTQLKNQEEAQFISLLNLLNGVYIPEGGAETRVWTASQDGSFSVSSFFSTITNESRERNVVSGIRKMKAPMRVLIFGWLAIRKRILTQDNLRRRGIIVVNGCPMCLREEE